MSDKFDFSKTKHIDFAEAQREMEAEFEARRKRNGKPTPKHVSKELADARAIRSRDNASDAEEHLTIEQLRSKYGHRWGFAAHDEHVERQRKAIAEKLHESRNILFQRECVSQGLPANSAISPGLLRSNQEYCIRRQLTEDNAAHEVERMRADEEQRLNEAERKRK